MFKRLSEFEPTNSFIAYFDILGYKNIVEKGIYNKKLAQIMENVISKFREYNEQANFISSEIQKLHMRIFSDNFIIYTGCDWETLIDIVALMQGRFSFDGVFVRGAMCYGELYANNEFVFGKGLIDVVALEDRAIYPRVVIDDSFKNAVFNEVQNHTKLADYIISEGHTNYVNYIKQYAEACLHNSKADFIWFLNNHKNFITENIKVHSNCERVLEKYVWSKNYHNRYCEENNYREFLIV